MEDGPVPLSGLFTLGVICLPSRMSDSIDRSSRCCSKL